MTRCTEHGNRIRLNQIVVGQSPRHRRGALYRSELALGAASARKCGPGCDGAGCSSPWVERLEFIKNNRSELISRNCLFFLFLSPRVLCTAIDEQRSSGDVPRMFFVPWNIREQPPNILRSLAVHGENRKNISFSFSCVRAAVNGVSSSGALRCSSGPLRWFLRQQGA